MRKFLRFSTQILMLVFLLMFFAQLLTSRPYMSLSEGRYATHEQITYDHRYVAHELIDYLNYRHDDLTFGATATSEEVLMRDIEIRHMVDVKNLYTVLRIIAFGSGLLAFGYLFYLYKKDLEELANTLKTMFLLPLFFTVFLGGWMLIDFRRVFNNFHELFFSNDDWILRADDVLIQLLPTPFWMTSAMIILGLLVLSQVGFYLVGRRLSQKMKKFSENA
jgi:integral membrane protein (TIGR01906 family)